MPKPEDHVAALLDSDRRALLVLSLKNPPLIHRAHSRGLVAKLRERDCGTIHRAWSIDRARDPSGALAPSG